MRWANCAVSALISPQSWSSVLISPKRSAIVRSVRAFTLAMGCTSFGCLLNYRGAYALSLFSNYTRILTLHGHTPQLTALRRERTLANISKRISVQRGPRLDMFIGGAGHAEPPFRSSPQLHT